MVFDDDHRPTRGLASIVAANIRFEAAMRELTQADLAAVVGLSRPAISQRYTGKVAWTLEEVGRVAMVMGIRPGELMTMPKPAVTMDDW